MPSLKFTPTKLNGWVEFSIPNITHPALGDEGATAVGKYRRLQPFHSRAEVDRNVIKPILNRIIASAEECGFKYGHIQRFPLQKIAENAILFGIYCISDVSLDSLEMEFITWCMFWSWIYDDPLEEAWSNGTLHKENVESLKTIHATFLKIIRMQWIDPVYPEVKEFPLFHAICNCMQKMARIGVNLAGGEEEYVARIEPFAVKLQASFEANEWYTVGRINEGSGRYNLSTYHAWRNLNCGAIATFQLVVFAKKIQLSPEIWRHPAFNQMHSIVMNSVQWINEILGIKKDLEYYQSGDPDSEVVFRILNKGENIHSVVAETCLKMGEDLQDLILIKEALVALFGEDENLIRYFNVVDTFLDGQNQVYVENERYRIKGGFVTLIREDGIQESG